MKVGGLAKRVISDRRKKLFGWRAVFERVSEATKEGLVAVENRIGTHLPDDLRAWLLTVGYCNIGDDKLAFREIWFEKIEEGPATGTVIFAQDVLGNFYSFSTDGSIFYIARSEREVGRISASFSEFMTTLIDKNYDIEAWMRETKMQRY